jgi:transposase
LLQCDLWSKRERAMGRRGELTDAAWVRLRPLLPENGRRGKQWRDHRQVINGILWRLRVGAPWRDVPERYGPWQTCYDRFVRWRRDGTWDRLLALAQSAADAAGAIDWTICIDGTIVRAHQHATGARRRRSAADRAARATHPVDEALGRSRGGRTTKLHLACDGRGRVLAVVLTPGQRHESTQLGVVLDAIHVPRPGGRGRPRKRPDHVIADKGYSYPVCRRLLRRRGLAHTIPERRDQRRRRSARPGRPPAFDAARYRARNVIERCVEWLKRWRAVATRYDKRALNYRAVVVIAALLHWLIA